MFDIIVDFRNIQSVSFPAVTVCAPNSGKWQALVAALNHFDKDGLIFDIIKEMNPHEPFFREAFDPNIDYQTWKIITNQFDPPLRLNSDLPKRLHLLAMEKELFLVLHFACFVSSYDCADKIINTFSPWVLYSVLSQKTRQETVEETCQYLLDYHHYLIDYENINCTSIDFTTREHP